MKKSQIFSAISIAFFIPAIFSLVVHIYAGVTTGFPGDITIWSIRYIPENMIILLYGGGISFSILTGITRRKEKNKYRRVNTRQRQKI